MFFPSSRRPLAAAALLLAWFLAPFPLPAAHAAGKKKRDPGIEIRFHVQVAGYDPTFAAKVRVGNPPQELTVEKIASLSERDFASFYPYRAADGSFSAVCKLDRHGEATLEALSTEHRGSLLLVVVNGQPLTTLLIDRTINDGIIFIPNGLTEANIRAMGASFSILALPGSGPANRRQPNSDLPSQSRTE